MCGTRLLTACLALACAVTLPAFGSIAAAQPKAAQASGRNLYVDPKSGDDRNTGLASEKRGADAPFKTIHKAVRSAQPGDTVHLNPQASPYREVAVFYNLHGEPGRPIIFDAHGATITGAEPLNPADCRQIAPGLYRTDKLIPAKLVTPEDAVSRRWFFLYAGKINRMGRVLKGKTAPYKKPSELAPGEWTYQRDENAFYLKIDPQKPLADYKIEYPARGAGVQIGGDCAHLVIRNLIATHVYNDGYNIHGRTRDVRYENIQSIECGDDGFSAHDECDSVIDGFVSIANGTAIANGGQCSTTTNRMFADKNLGTDLLFFGSGVHTITNSRVRCTGAYSVRLWGADAYDNICTLGLQNVLLERGGDTSPITIGHNGAFELDHVTLLGLDLQAAGKSVSVRNSALGGKPAPEWSLLAAVGWTADHNLYDLKLLKLGNTAYDRPVFNTYQQMSSQDADSLWTGFRYPRDGASNAAWPLPGAGCDGASIRLAP